MIDTFTVNTTEENCLLPPTATAQTTSSKSKSPFPRLIWIQLKLSSTEVRWAFTNTQTDRSSFGFSILLDSYELPTVPNPFDQWMEAYASPEDFIDYRRSGPENDLDGDGILNWVEYHLGWNPTEYENLLQINLHPSADGSGAKVTLSHPEFPEILQTHLQLYYSYTNQYWFSNTDAGYLSSSEIFENAEGESWIRNFIEDAPVTNTPTFFLLRYEGNFDE